MIWILSNVPDPEAPDEPFPSFPPKPNDITELIVKYKDSVIEAFKFDGRLIVSERFADYRDAPYPMVDELWYRIQGELVPSVIVLSVSLVRDVQKQ